MFFLPILSLLVAGKEQVKYTFKKTKNKLKSEHTGIYQQKPPSCKPHFMVYFPQSYAILTSISYLSNLSKISKFPLVFEMPFQVSICGLESRISMGDGSWSVTPIQSLRKLDCGDVLANFFILKYNLKTL